MHFVYAVLHQVSCITASTAEKAAESKPACGYAGPNKGPKPASCKVNLTG